MSTTPAVPIKALVAFNAAMKHASFSLAAQELHVTPGAVGQQIRNLEEWLGTPLFVRSVRQVQPTAQALAYWGSVGPALARIEQASVELREQQQRQQAQAQQQRNAVWLSMPPTLAAKWFAPRMAAFLQHRPDVSLHLGATTALSDFEREPVDLAIRYFDGKDAALRSTLLYPDEARLYSAPDYLRRLRIKTPDDLARATLLHTTLLPYWKPWLQRFSQLSGAQVDAIAGQHFDQSMMALETARHGQGVVLSSAILTEVELREGWLVEPFPAMRLPVGKGYYLVHRRGGVLRPAAAALKAWLVATAKAERLRD
ncbi:LysR family glycine cleavage system transcriptional activator [Acidovorax soli]|uniref:LysR family glycine cleavage system transcriptional activator n=1 Tax=Acidovorax soli TaxID=592050 RepID=A0A7X0PMY2_9BURK|nr:LysR substrate-binding domain-containing protein [Acidovorax soli]MBB6564351.1 LysR family glycine cleavage system transcriptional activator [Acidovorax soli]